MLYRYPYISHLILNAGVAAWSHIDFPLFFYLLATAGPIDVVEIPTWSAQKSGVMSSDNLGWVWQSNVFGHYVLVRSTFIRLKNSILIACLSFDSCSHCLRHTLLIARLHLQRAYCGCHQWRHIPASKRKIGNLLRPHSLIKGLNIRWTFYALSYHEEPEMTT